MRRMPVLGRRTNRGIVAGIAAAAVAGIPIVAVADVPAAPLPAGAVFYTPVAAQTVSTSTSSVHLMLGAASNVDSIKLEYVDASGPHPIATVRRSTPSGAFDDIWNARGMTGTVTLRATAYAAPVGTAPAVQVGAPAEEQVTLSTTSGSRFTFTGAPARGVRVGVYERKDRHWFAAVSGTTTGSVQPQAVAASTSAAILPRLAWPMPAGAYSAGSPTFTEPVDLTAYAPAGIAPNAAVVRVSDGVSSDARDISLYSQTVTAVRATTRAVPGTDNVTITATVTDQYGQPVAGAPLRLGGHVAGVSTPLSQLAISDVHGQVSYTGPSGSTAGYPAGGYLVYADLNVNNNHGGHEPSFQVVHGTVSYAAPGRSLYHSDKRIKKAGGVYADAAKGTKAAHARGFTWIDQDGQLSYASKAVQRVGRISQASDLVWVNAHGSPFNPKWLKKGKRFESKTWSKIAHHRGLRDAGKTFKQDAAHGLSVEWEVKDVHPLSKGRMLNAAFDNLAAEARRYYGSAWASRVQIKVLSNLHGGQKYALKVLKHAHSRGFTTMFLARGKATYTQIPASAQRFVTYVRGARGGEYPTVQTAAPGPIRVTTPPRA